MKYRKFTLWLGGLLLGALCAFVLLFRSWESMGGLAPVESRLSAWPRSTAVRDRKGALLSVTLSEDGEFCLPVLLSEMGRWMPLVVVEVEDRRFWSHGGVDWFSLARAALGNVFLKKGRTGASTITSQIIRICWPAERNVRTKLREFAQARSLEKRHSKEELLATYLNIIPLGSNLRGVEAAALAWFGRSCRDLTIAQAALLAVMVKGPTAYRPDLHPKAALARRNWAISLLEKRGRITAEQARLARAEPLPTARRALPADEWVFCAKAASLSPERDITSTLDRAMQKTLRAALLDALAEFDTSVTASGVLIENKTGAVRAYVPNARRGQKGAPAEWVDCASALRSPGSALKPFAYALAFEDGTLSPASLMADTPLTLSGRAPRNFDRIYRGPVSAAVALVDSLNVPAVRILRREGGERLLQKLRLLGFSSLTQTAAHYGDSLVLGGCEVSPMQLATAATALAREGELVRPRFAESDPVVEHSVFSPESAWITTNILADPSRLPTLLRSVDPVKGRFAFKTGTSYGLRDAWTVGWNDRWTLAVWLGDPTGEPHPGLVGLGAAAPAVLETLRALPGGGFSAPPPGVTVRQVCALSGQLPSPLCPRTVKEYAVAGISPSAACTMHHLEQGKVVVVWPPELSAYMESPREKKSELSITSPLADASYLKHEEGANLVLRAEGSGEYFWFVDGRYVGRGTADRPCLWPMKRGKHRLSVTDALGRQKAIRFSVYTLDDNPSAQIPDLVPVD